ncbi:hypothetical protein FACS1894218_3350 [Bacilli bacterium]|nr:hypothetical protein FACS1894218_3350 [Bacilli bacterium]
MQLAITIFMTMGAVFIGIFSVPNLVAVLKTKNTAGVNLPMYLIFTTACIFFAIYGLGIVIDANFGSLYDRLSGGLPTMIANIFCVLIAIITLSIKFINMGKSKKEGLTELKY